MIQLPHSEWIRQSKLARRAVAEFARVAIQSGRAQAAIIALPDEQPRRRDTYLAVNSMAFSLLGRGGYTLTAPPFADSALLSWG